MIAPFNVHLPIARVDPPRGAPAAARAKEQQNHHDDDNDDDDDADRDQQPDAL